jgi:pimeloyl-ACP methyl ester carboxylesterase
MRWRLVFLCSVLLLLAAVGFAVGVFSGRKARRVERLAPISAPADPVVAREQPPVVHLNRYYHFEQLMRDPRVEGELRRYRATHDGSTQTLLILRPAGRRPQSVCFFFHGMGGDCGDGVVAHDLVTSLDAVVVCPGGRGPAWLADAFVADMTQVISDHAAGYPRVFLAGISMGGTQALALAALLPVRLRDRLSGVIALIPEADLVSAATHSSNLQVRSTLLDSARGDLAQLRERSPRQRRHDYNKDLSFVILYNEADTILPVADIKDFIEELRRDGHPVVAYAAPGEHSFVYSNFDYGEVFHQIGRSNAAPQPAPTYPVGTEAGASGPTAH